MTEPTPLPSADIVARANLDPSGRSGTMTWEDVARALLPTERPAETIIVTATNSTGTVRFLARILRKGDRYGLANALTWDEERPGVEFYDTRYPHTPFGQFVSRYYVETILGTDGYGSGMGGLDLMGYEASWKLDAVSMTLVRNWLTHQTTR